MTRRSMILMAAGGSLALLAGAYLFQAMGYAPCKMCLWQRWPHAAAVALGVAGAVVPLALLTLLAWAGALAALTTGGIGIYHTGVERGWWEGPTSCSGTGNGLTGLSGADLLSTEGVAQVVMCDQVAWSLFGLSMASWNTLFSLLLVAVWIVAARARG